MEENKEDNKIIKTTNTPSKKRMRIKIKPSVKIIAGFLIIILIGAFFLSLPVSSKAGSWTNFVDSLFTSFSSVCVTGFSVVSAGSHFSYFGQAVLLLLVQIGGLGFMTAATFMLLIMRRKISFKNRLEISQSLGEDSLKGIVRLVRNILIMTFSIELIGALILLPVFCVDNGAIGIWQAVFTSVSAFCNAGFDIFTAGSSLTGYTSNAVVNLTVAFLIILGGLGFVVIMDILKNKGRFKKLSFHSKVVLVTTVILIIIGTIFFFAVEYNNPDTLGSKSGGVKLLASFFQSVSARTAGFETINQSLLRDSSKFFSDILMFIGASPCSTGGGIKTTTFTLLIFTIVSGLKNRDSVVLGKHSISYKAVFKAVGILLIGLSLTLGLTIFLTISERTNLIMNELQLYNFENILHDAFSAFSTTGQTTGIIPYLSKPGKFAVMFTMFAGRIGLLNLGMAFFSAKDTVLIKYPEGNISIG